MTGDNRRNAFSLCCILPFIIAQFTNSQTISVPLWWWGYRFFIGKKYGSSNQYNQNQIHIKWIEMSNYLPWWRLISHQCCPLMEINQAESYVSPVQLEKPCSLLWIFLLNAITFDQSLRKKKTSQEQIDVRKRIIASNSRSPRGPCWLQFGVTVLPETRLCNTSTDARMVEISEGVFKHIINF